MEIGQLNELSHCIIAAAIEIHRALGPGLLESTYRTCMLYELRERQMKVVSEQMIPVRYKHLVLDGNYRIDLMVNDTTPVIPPAHGQAVGTSDKFKRRGSCAGR
jgi:GxxExxY protein